jgi:hypothetical protein
MCNFITCMQSYVTLPLFFLVVLIKCNNVFELNIMVNLCSFNWLEAHQESLYVNDMRQPIPKDQSKPLPPTKHQKAKCNLKPTQEFLINSSTESHITFP